MNTSRQSGSSSLASPLSVTFHDDRMRVELSDGRAIIVPLAWYPRLARATREQLEDYELSPCGIHWEALDEDVSVSGLLAGRGDQTRAGKVKRYLEV